MSNLINGLKALSVAFCAAAPAAMADDALNMESSVERIVPRFQCISFHENGVWVANYMSKAEEESETINLKSGMDWRRSVLEDMIEGWSQHDSPFGKEYALQAIPEFQKGIDAIDEGAPLCDPTAIPMV